MDIKTIRREAETLAATMTSEEIKALSDNLSDVEHMALMIALENEIEARMAVNKKRKIEQEDKEDRERHVAKVVYDKAKEALRKEKHKHWLVEASFTEEKAKHKAERERHALTEASFTEEKAKHKAETDRFAQAVARFKIDAEPWREISRKDKDAKRLKDIKEDQEHQENLKALKDRLGVPDDVEDMIEVEKRRAADHECEMKKEAHRLKVQTAKDTRYEILQRKAKKKRDALLKKREKAHWQVPTKKGER